MATSTNTISDTTLKQIHMNNSTYDEKNDWEVNKGEDDDV